MEVDTTLASVDTVTTRGGNTRYVVRDADGNEYTTFREEIGGPAQPVRRRSPSPRRVSARSILLRASPADKRSKRADGHRTRAVVRARTARATGAEPRIQSGSGTVRSSSESQSVAALSLGARQSP